MRLSGLRISSGSQRGVAIAAGLPDQRRLRAGGRFSADVGQRSFLRRGADRHRGRGVGAGRGTDRRSGGCRRSEGTKLFGERRKARRFARLLDRTFRLRSELRSLPSAETIVCRCEDVPYSRLQEHRSWRAAKLHTRCGMGPCQGRICGPATQFLFQWNPDSVRPPVFPARVESLAKVVSAGP